MRRRRWRGRRAVAGVVLAIVGLLATGTVTSTGTAAASIAPVIACAGLAGTAIGPGGTVTSATVVEDRIGTYCQVRGRTGPGARFVLKLPVDGWQGQYVQEGCGQYCGAVPLNDHPAAGAACTAVTDGRLALAADDMGHAGADAADGRWAANNPAARLVFGVSSEHTLDQVARTVIDRYYGRAPAHSYFDGCSTGGREALMLAQRFPADFDGIVAGAPAGNFAALAGMFQAWLVRSNTGPAGHQILTAEKLPALHEAVLRACADRSGVIEDPGRCAFDPASIECAAGRNTPSCLTSAQVTVVRDFYRGPTDPAGRNLFNGGMPYGSEPGWRGVAVQPAADRAAPNDTVAARLALNYLEYMGFQPDPPAGFGLADVPFTDAEFARLNRIGDRTYNANDPDLSAFAAHGGRLILYHGLADQYIPPQSTVDYYAAVERAAGGFAAAQRFSRLYLVPGAYHCLVGPDRTVASAGFLGAMIGWVEHGRAPGAIPADIRSSATGRITVAQTVRPVDALAPAAPAPGSLNGHYHYVGSYP